MSQTKPVRALPAGVSKALTVGGSAIAIAAAIAVLVVLVLTIPFVTSLDESGATVRNDGAMEVTLSEGDLRLIRSDASDNECHVLTPSGDTLDLEPEPVRPWFLTDAGGFVASYTAETAGAHTFNCSAPEPAFVSAPLTAGVERIMYGVLALCLLPLGLILRWVGRRLGRGSKRLSR